MLYLIELRACGLVAMTTPSHGVGRRFNSCFAHQFFSKDVKNLPQLEEKECF